MTAAKTDVLIYGQPKKLVTEGLSESFTVHAAESHGDLGRISPAVAERIKAVAVTGLVSADRAMMDKFPKLEIISSFGVGYDHVDWAHARDHNIVVTNTPDVLTEEVADVAMGLLLATLREFIRADRFVRAGQWATQNYPLTVGSLRGRTVGMVGMGRIGQAIARRLEASLVPVVYHSRNPAPGVSNKHYPNLVEMAKAVDTLVVITPGGASTAKIVNAEVIDALGPNGVIVNVARGSVIDEPALIAALKAGKILGAGLDVFANEPNVPDELRALQNTVLLPHVGSASIVTRNAMDKLVVDNLKLWFDGKPPLTPIPETPVKGR
ncbi:2-hydroxyacid dehydrogenase [Bradyrhizobium sp. U87765 SZCCT0131]|uniref:2-hydroxyacid dehydrogenase n=1 Tax=unclassified Bradyrhizobium TaxID=2631580 RepID=UPI001BAB23E8|nr:MULTISPECIES: 2-hydroxyacid dehydrogenase [unclassified Bradyrhizobium]MBR1217207.1 2-hydroxyacid dehydrogenase [Bradyrhizobium sp. U87765 SZCCT0131]MBR1259037.1 2-hydroxyacid dehydrogenase [Bradyrhizobium sp. U87765 SZCCT0134]MBR1305178.1 2-hydroxyacid dehydrogenase [Bradyrhizobium sp. U87765 SZCCT0110]MBR1320964.1 2-hydroxyacid dehydrogenase [Bradyrhizobium sp. U87765 SZCCT0109]MBR1350382.1 2-hydroxyacid dehydrogenase [Bradyrhizobium sp. U87765 SZCCT0048]